MHKLLVAAASIAAGGILFAAGASAQPSSTLQLVVLSGSGVAGAAAAAPTAGAKVTFNVQTAASQPWVSVSCAQNGRLVYGQYWGFWSGYNPTTVTSTMAVNGVFTLSSALWTSGSASCTATLYAANAKSSKQTVLATLPFTVNG